VADEVKERYWVAGYSNTGDILSFWMSPDMLDMALLRTCMNNTFDTPGVVKAVGWHPDEPNLDDAHAVLILYGKDA
jgi:hypothetical protein